LAAESWNYYLLLRNYEIFLCRKQTKIEVNVKDAQNSGTLRKEKYECSWEQVSLQI